MADRVAREETFIAGVSRWPVRVLLLFLVIPATIYLLGFVQGSWVSIFGSLFILAFAFAIDSRVGDMRLALSGDRVEVVNFLSSASFNVHTVKIDVKEEASNWPRDDIPAAVREPSSDGSVPNINALYLSDGDGRRIRVGVAPSYGGRTAIIVDDLRAAIAKHRSY